MSKEQCVVLPFTFHAAPADPTAAAEAATQLRAPAGKTDGCAICRRFWPQSGCHPPRKRREQIREALP